MKDNLAPEEKLLRLIKGGEKPQITLLPKIKNREARQANKARAPKFLAVFQAKRFIPLAFVLACAYLAVSFSWPLIFTRKAELPAIEAENIPADRPEPAKAVKPLDYYLGQVRGRRVFANEFNQQPPAAEKPASAAGADLIKGINLVGIIAGENPQVAIEDLKSRRTYYVNKGQSVGDLTIDEIKEGKVIIDYKGQKFELYL